MQDIQNAAVAKLVPQERSGLNVYSHVSPHYVLLASYISSTYLPAVEHINVSSLAIEASELSCEFIARILYPCQQLLQPCML